MSVEKVCVLCGEDCSGRARVKDNQGNYYCAPCHASAESRKRISEAISSVAPTPTPRPSPETEPSPSGTVESDPYRVATADETVAAINSARRSAGSQPDAHGPVVTCPSCDQHLPGGTQVCVTCGINVNSGRAILVHRGVDEDSGHYKAERYLRPLSWVIGSGFAPVASDAFGNRKPYAVWTALILTCIVSLVFWFSTEAQMKDRKNWMQWSGDATPSAEYLLELYAYTDWGDAPSFYLEYDNLAAQTAGEPRDIDVARAHAALPLRQRTLGEFRLSQLLTSALLHADIFHLAGNMLFLVIFGSRVNALIGNVATVVLLPILAALSAWADLIAMSSQMPIAGLGASGVTMGLAGMYLVFFPLNRMYMSAWFRFLFFFRIKIWAVRGIWVVLFFIAWDVFYVALGAETGVAHWAHLGGFIAGVILGLAMLLSRVFNAGGTDLLSITLGKHVWALTGRPSEQEKVGFCMPKLEQPGPPAS